MSKHHGSTLSSLFDELGERPEVEALAAKKTLAIQMEKRMKALGLTAGRLATRMGTSRAQVQRILDANEAGITLKVLTRLAGALEGRILIEFEATTPTTQASSRPARAASTKAKAAKKGRKTLKITPTRKKPVRVSADAELA